MSQSFIDNITRSNNDILRMNNKGYALSGSIYNDRRMIDNNNKTKNEYISSGSAKRTDDYITSVTTHKNPVDNFVDYIVGGHDKAKQIDNNIDSAVSYVSDKVDTVANMPKYIFYAGLFALVIYIIKK